MGEAPSNLDPWKRANLEQFDVATLNLHPQGLREEYTRIMKQLAHTKAIAALALEQVYLAEQEREAHFAPFIKEPPHCSLKTTGRGSLGGANTGYLSDNNTELP